MLQLSVAKYQKLGPTVKNRLQIWNLCEKVRVLRQKKNELFFVMRK